MDIILDTNIFRNDLFFKSKDFEVLKDYLIKTDSRFVLLQIIIEEIKGLYKRILEDEQANYSKSRKVLNQILNREYIKEIKIDTNEELKNYIEFVFKKLGINDDKIIKYRNEYLPEIVKRAINRLKPFKDEDKGFRDTIIWLTALDYCQKSHEKQIIFISNNSKDFGDMQNPSELNQNLKKECEDLGVKINYFRTPKDFIEKHSKKIDFIDNDWIANNVDDDWLSNVICDAVNDSKNYRIKNWYEYKTGNKSNDQFRILGAMIYDPDDIFIYEMVDDTLIINFTIQAEIEAEFEYYNYEHYDFEEYRNINSETKYINGTFYISLVYKEEKIEKIEVTDFGII